MGKGLHATAVAVAASLAAWGAVAAADERPGRAIRVERRVNREVPGPRALSVQQGAVLRSYGWAPKVGDSLTLIDARGVVGEATVTAVAATAGSCPGRTWESQFRADSTARSFGYGTFAIYGADLTDRARTLTGTYMKSPSGRDSDSVWVVIDANDDGEPNLVITAWSCPDDEIGRTLGGQPYCMDTYVRAGPDKWEQRAHDVWFACD